jgi:hypothetical protein
VPPRTKLSSLSAIKSWVLLRPQYDKIWSSKSQFLGRGGGTAAVAGKKPAVESAGKRDMAVHRLLSLGSFDICLISLIADKRTHGAVQAQEWADTTHDHKFRAYFYATRPGFSNTRLPPGEPPPHVTSPCRGCRKRTLTSLSEQL